MATIPVRLYFPHSERFGNATSLLFFLSSVLLAPLDAFLSLGSFLSFLEDSLASYYENVDTHLSIAMVNTFFQVWTSASSGLVEISS